LHQFTRIGKSILHHLEKSIIDSALIYKETKIDYALPKFGKKKEIVAPVVIKNPKTH